MGTSSFSQMAQLTIIHVTTMPYRVRILLLDCVIELNTSHPYSYLSTRTNHFRAAQATLAQSFFDTFDSLIQLLSLHDKIGYHYFFLNTPEFLFVLDSFFHLLKRKQITNKL